MGVDFIDREMIVPIATMSGTIRVVVIGYEKHYK